eukprot:6329032-Amphidinium_carterae.1
MVHSSQIGSSLASCSMAPTPLTACCLQQSAPQQACIEKYTCSRTKQGPSRAHKAAGQDARNA